MFLIWRSAPREWCEGGKGSGSLELGVLRLLRLLVHWMRTLRSLVDWFMRVQLNLLRMRLLRLLNILKRVVLRMLSRGLGKLARRWLCLLGRRLLALLDLLGRVGLKG